MEEGNNMHSSSALFCCSRLCEKGENPGTVALHTEYQSSTWQEVSSGGRPCPNEGKANISSSSGGSVVWCSVVGVVVANVQWPKDPMSKEYHP